MPNPTPSQFINLDLVLRSSSDLTPLAEYLGERVFVLSSGAAEGEFHLVLEAGIVASDPETYIQYFLRLIDALPPEQRTLWAGCSSRIFDFGFEGGYNAPPLQMKLQPTMLGIFAERGLTVEITFYAHNDDPI